MDASELNGLPETAYTDSLNSDVQDDNGLLDDDDTRLIELVGFLVQGIVTHPEEVEVEEFYDEVGIVFGVRVHPDDIGRVIGKEGRVANALRHLVKAAATKIGEHVTVEILTEDDVLPEGSSNS